MKKAHQPGTVSVRASPTPCMCHVGSGSGPNCGTRIASDMPYASAIHATSGQTDRRSRAMTAWTRSMRGASSARMMRQRKNSLAASFVLPSMITSAARNSGRPIRNCTYAAKSAKKFVGTISAPARPWRHARMAMGA